VTADVVEVDHQQRCRHAQDDQAEHGVAGAAEHEQQQADREQTEHRETQRADKAREVLRGRRAVGTHAERDQRGAAGRLRDRRRIGRGVVVQHRAEAQPEDERQAEEPGHAQHAAAQWLDERLREQHADRDEAEHAGRAVGHVAPDQRSERGEADGNADQEHDLAEQRRGAYTRTGTLAGRGVGAALEIAHTRTLRCTHDERGVFRDTVGAQARLQRGDAGRLCQPAGRVRDRRHR
jgi:hypothetical protein